jgi:2-(1,2-epoxy-1,2-dihydrophenyl)acetyl-CoA isomerase
MSTEPVLLDVEDGVARLRLNRPKASNALNKPLFAALIGAVRTIQRDDSVRVVLLSGEGKNFCGGGDVAEFAAKGEALPGHLREVTAMQEGAVTGLVNLRAPVVALVQGAATGGGGTGLICASDIVLAGPRAKFMLGATRVGMAPDAGVSVSLTQIIGFRQALRYALLNPLLGPEEALAIGLVTEVLADDEALAARGAEIAAQLAAGAALSQAETKRLFWNGLGRSFEASLPDESRTVSALGGTADAREGLAAVLERRSAEFGKDG